MNLISPSAESKRSVAPDVMCSTRPTKSSARRHLPSAAARRTPIRGQRQFVRRAGTLRSAQDVLIFDPSVRLSSFTAERCIEYHLIVPPELLKKCPCHVEVPFRLRRWQRSRHDLADATAPIDGIKQELFRLFHRQEQIPAGV